MNDIITANSGAGSSADTSPRKRQAMESTKELKQAGLRVTGPRLKILELFDTLGKKHLSAEDVYQELAKRGESLSLATIYRVLAQFESAGLLVRHHLEEGKAVFELGRMGDHNHLICVQCGQMTCFTDDAIDRRQRSIAKEHGFELKDYSLYTYVNCRRDPCPHRTGTEEPTND